MTDFLSKESTTYVSYDTYVHYKIMRQFDVLQGDKPTLYLKRYENLSKLLNY